MRVKSLKKTHLKGDNMESEKSRGNRGMEE